MPDKKDKKDKNLRRATGCLEDMVRLSGTVPQLGFVALGVGPPPTPLVSCAGVRQP
jgi:hypothetical protein